VRNGYFHSHVVLYIFSNSSIAYYKIPFFKADLIAGIINNYVTLQPTPKHDRHVVGELTRVLKIHMMLSKITRCTAKL